MFKVCKVTLVDSTANILSEYHDDVHVFFNGLGGQGTERNATAIRQGGATSDCMPVVGVSIQMSIISIPTLGCPKPCITFWTAPL